MADILPRLILDRLDCLPRREVPPEEASEAAAIVDLRSRFSAGAELAAKLEARAAAFLDPSTEPEARGAALATADKATDEARKKLDQATAPAEEALGREEKGPGDGAAPGSPSGPPPIPMKVALWSGHAKDELVDAKSGARAAAKASSVDLLVVGSIELRSGYALVAISGYDRALERFSLEWEGVCSVEDPTPLADEAASRIELWVAGRDFARLELKVSPASARVSLDGRDCGQERVAYAFRAGPLLVEAEASGYLPFREAIDLAPGDRKSLDIELSPLSLGSALVLVDPPGASVSIDSMPLGEAPLTVALDGTRGILSASSEGREGQTVVLPVSGDATIELSLPPVDDLGPAGRVEAARKDFFASLGWVVCAIPLTGLSIGAYNIYAEAATRSADEGTGAALVASQTALAAVAAATAVAATNMVVHLVKYLRTAR